MSRTSKQKSGHLHVEAFNLAARDLLAKQSEKNYEELNRVITALSEVRNPQVIKGGYRGRYFAARVDNSTVFLELLKEEYFR